jgi:hypothetical protein
MKKTAFLTVVLLAASCLLAENSSTMDFCPVDLNSLWTYSFFSKKENRQKDDIAARIVKTEKYGGLPCFVYEVPSRGMSYYGYRDETAVYLKAAKISLPVLGFITADIVFEPAAVVLKLPVKTGDSWRYEGTARVKALLFINIENKAWCDFKVLGAEKVDIGGKFITAYHLRCSASRSWNMEKPMTGDCWMADKLGLIRGETANSLLELKEYGIK